MFTALVLAAIVASPAGPPPDSHASVPLALVLSGGVSLGAYEAGLSWGIVSFARAAKHPLGSAGTQQQPRLVAVTGASAGSLNALLSAVLWCEQPGASEDLNVDRNLLHDAWTRVGLDQLLPDNAAKYDASDGILTSHPLIEVLNAVEQDVFATNATRLFRPGCFLPLGVTVTRVNQDEQHRAGLSTLTQKFVVPWALSVSPAGRPRVERQALVGTGSASDTTLDLAESLDAEGTGASLAPDQVSQTLLASGAFPEAFAPRVLCDCTPDCPDEQTVTSESCPGPNGPLTRLVCQSSSDEEAPMKICRRTYVDGGIFDNAPVGLAIALTESTIVPNLLTPVQYIFIDPDMRRLQPPSAAHPEDATGRGVSGGLQLLRNLASTSRNADLTRAVRADSWNRTTRGLLRDMAAAFPPFIQIHRELQALRSAEAQPVPAPLPPLLPSIQDRAALGRTLMQCLASDRLSNVGARQCAQRLVEFAAPTEELTRRAGALEAVPLSDEEVVQLAEKVATLGAPRPSAPELKGVSRSPSIDQAPSMLDDATADRLVLGTAAGFYLAEEVDRVAGGSLPESRLQQFKTALLQTVKLARLLAVGTSQAANGLLLEQLRRLGKVFPNAPELAQAQAKIEALPAGELFNPELGLDSVLWQATTSADPSAEAASTALLQLFALHARIQRAASHANAIAHQATALEEQRGGERSLIPSDRFAPLTSSMLFNFGGFLDRPFREFDYYAGVYEALHTVSLAVCNNPSLAPLPPQRLADAPNQLDLAALDTQRCVGDVMHWATGVLGLDSSPRAQWVVSHLARAELDAVLDSSALATQLRHEPAWSWMDALPQDLPKEPVVAIFGALMSHRAPCHADSKEALCAAEMPFEEFLDALKAHGYEPVEASMQRALSDRDGWWLKIARKALDRSLAVELSEPGASTVKNVTLLAHYMGEWWLQRDFASASLPRFVLDSSTIPRRPPADLALWPLLLSHLVPYRISFDIARGGAAVAWVEPALHLSNAFSLLSSFEPVDYESARRQFATTVGVRPTLHLGGISVGVGPRLSLPWHHGLNTELGVEGRVGFLQDRFEIGIGARRLSAADSDHGLLVSLSIGDLNGTAYWLAR